MKNKYKFLLVLLLLLVIFPIKTYAISPKYKDIVKDVVDVEQEENKVNIYFFFGDGCMHCAKEEKFLKALKDRYGDKINIYKYETWYDDDNLELMKKAKILMKDDVNISVPYTVVGTSSFNGYSDNVGRKIETKVKEYLEIISEEESVVESFKEDIPLLGRIDKRDVSITLVAIILGFIDGFNPCAMWVLLFLINMLIGMNDKRKMLLIGMVFLLTSAIMYFLFMLGITNILSFLKAREIRAIIGLVALILGSYNVYKFFKERKDTSGCTVVDDKKRKKIFSRIKKFTTEKNIFLALIGVVVLAISVNAVELACSSVFPATFAEIMAVNNVVGIQKIIYLLIYTFFYMIDDMIVFIIAVATLQLSTTSSKYGKYSKVVGGIIMLLVGLLLIFKPDWLMLNF